MPDQDKGFEVKDKRKAKEALEEEAKTAAEKQREKEDEVPSGGAEAGSEIPGVAGEEKGPSPKAGSEEQGPGAAQGRKGELPPIDFISFIGSLAATAYFNMGEKFSPDQKEPVVDLPAAKQMIDLIDLVKAKTAGNLEKEESEAMDSILYNLRMRFVHESNKK